MRARAVLLAIGLLAGTACRRATERPPGEAVDLAGADVLLVTLDTLRADALGFAGNARVETPVLDRLAAGGRVFDDAHAHNVVTLPSHANILTGLYPYQHGVRDNAGFVLPREVPTLATMLQGAGYATGAFVAAFPLDSRFGLDRGFDVYDDAYPRGGSADQFVVAERRGDQVVAAARAWWDAHRGRKRFLWVHLYDPHAGYEPPEPFRSRYADAPYLGEVAATDSFLAPLLDPLLAGREAKALVIVTSDHGEALGEHGELTHGLFAYEPTLKVPLVVWAPGVAPGRDPRPARHVDIVPTVLAGLALEVPESLPGRSLLAPAEPRTASYFEALSTNLNRGWAPLRGTLRDRRKLIELPLPELYDLAADPGEESNLFAAERRAARELAGLLPEESAWPPPQGAVPQEVEAQLRSLGYGAGSTRAKGRYTAADDPKNLVAVDRRIHEVIDRYSRGDFAAAADLARGVVEAHPELADAWEHLALCLRQLERHGEAVAVLQAAIGKGVDRPSVRRQLGLALSEAGRAGEAVGVLAPLAAEPNADPGTVNAYGIALTDSGRHGEAITLLEGLAARLPEDPVTRQNLGIALLRADRPGDARRQLELALQANPGLAVSWNTLGVARYRLGDPPGAMSAWEKAASLDGRQYDALYNLGLVAAEAGRVAEARSALGRFAATAPPQRFAADIAKAERLLARLGR